MNTTTKKLKKVEKDMAARLDKEFGGLRKWVYVGDMTDGRLVIVITAREKK